VLGHPKAKVSFSDLVDIPDQFKMTAEKAPFLILNDTVNPNSPLEGKFIFFF